MKQKSQSCVMSEKWHAWAILGLLLTIFVPKIALAQTPEEILDSMDRQMTFDSRHVIARMEIYKGTAEPDVKRLEMWSKEWDSTFSVFLSPERDKGVRYLKLGDQLHMASAAGDVVQISGHMLRNGLMDSDFSYEDMMEARAMKADYNVTLIGDEPLEGKSCWILELNEKKPGQTYSKRKVWIEKETYLPRKTELYAKGGDVLKILTQLGTATYGDRKYPEKIIMRDLSKKDSRTEIHFEKADFGKQLPENIFSRRNLRKSG